MAEALIKYETIDEEQLKDIMAGKRRSRPGWDDTLSDQAAQGRRPRKARRPAGPPIPAGQH